MRYLLEKVTECNTTAEEEALIEMLVRAGEELIGAGRAIRGEYNMCVGEFCVNFTFCSGDGKMGNEDTDNVQHVLQVIPSTL